MKQGLTQAEAYGLLADFIQDYIYQKGWARLNAMQVKAIEYILPEKYNILLTAGTAQGKTEAAFLPAITCIYDNRYEESEKADHSNFKSLADMGEVSLRDTSKMKSTASISGEGDPGYFKEPEKKGKTGVGILYISPLKALINDQFIRLEEMLKGTDLTITKWHGDANLSRKEKLVENPGGILQMTPESLEAMLCCHPERIVPLFSNLRFIIIDEIHYFMSNERGLQLLPLFERLSRRAGCKPVRIGLSATISNSQDALDWLCTGSGRKGKVISYREEGHRVLCSVTSTRIGKEEFPERYIKKLLYQTKGKRALLFASSRKLAEVLISKIRKMALERGLPDVYHVHHGSIGKELRESTESIMKREEGPILTGTTLTLELGIDIGSLDEVIQSTDPPSISSMVQRLGRSGRRTGQAAISFQLRHQEDKGERKKLDMTLVRSIAMIELYFREHYLEEVYRPRLPFHFMVHEVIAVLYENGCLQPPRLAARILELSVFQNVSQDDFRDLLLHLMEKKVLCMYDDGAIGLDDRGEGIASSMDFYAIFVAELPMTVYCDGVEIGTIDRAYRPGDSFFLAGQSFEVVERDMNRKRLDVKPAEEEAEVSFGGYGEKATDRRLMEKIHEILSTETEYAYLDDDAKGILKDLRQKAKRYCLTQEIGRDTDGSLLLCPVLSDRTILTIWHILRAHDVTCERVYLRDFLYALKIKGMSEGSFRSLCRKLAGDKYMIDYGYVNRYVRTYGKYYNLLPENLKGKEIISDLLDMEGAREYFREM
ncbi:MAG: DEAD/DEAH box helicase [Eubacterium sp.]|nr:DEAD/DEAH box helicase [Eubacterium sp.]